MHYICDTETAKIHEAGKLFYFLKFIEDGGDFPVLTSVDLLYLPNDLEASIFLGFG